MVSNPLWEIVLTDKGLRFNMLANDARTIPSTERPRGKKRYVTSHNKITDIRNYHKWIQKIRNEEQFEKRNVFLQNVFASEYYKTEEWERKHNSS